MHEENQPHMMTLLLSLAVVASVLHTILHYFSNQSLTSLLLIFIVNPFHEQSPQYIGEDSLVTWIENDPKISGKSVFCQPFESQLILLEDSF
jgi:hypothetical protein